MIFYLTEESNLPLFTTEMGFIHLCGEKNTIKTLSEIHPSNGEKRHFKSLSLSPHFPSPFNAFPLPALQHLPTLF